MFLQKQSKDFTTPRFYFDGARIIDALTLYYFQDDITSKLELEYIIDGTNLKDIENIKILKEELGTDFIENQMYKQFTRNNDAGDEQIRNKFQQNLYADLKKQNNFLAVMFLYFFHKYYYDDENQNDVNDITKFKDIASILPTYRKMKTNALPTAKIIDEIKSIYPQIHNLFVKLLEIKYGSSANIALMQVQDAEQALKDVQLQGQIQKIKVKKNSKLELLKK